MKIRHLCFSALLLAAGAAVAQTILHDGVVEYTGRQGDIVAQSNIAGQIPVERISGTHALFGVGAVAGLDGEITVFDGRAYVTRIREGQPVMEDGTDTSAIFAAWTQHSEWVDVPVPAAVITYPELQAFIQQQAARAGINTNSTAFPFLMEGAPASVTWHINVDRTDGEPVTRESFALSKDYFVLENELVDIVGFYSEQQHGVFIGTFAPVMADTDVQNALHMHLVTRDRSSAGHIDDLLLGGGMTLRLPVLP